MRAIKVLFFRGTLGLVLAAVGCGKDSDGAGDKDQFISRLCDELADCCEAAGRPSDGAQCRVFYGAFAPSGAYDQAAGSACLEEIRAAGERKCEASSMTTPSCSKVFASGGTHKPGEACEDDSDCAPSASGRVECVSNYSAGATTRQCQVRAPGQAGSSPCVGTVDGNVTYSSGSSDAVPAMGYLCALDDGLSCDTRTGACEALGAEGAPCSGGSYQCVSSAYCAFSEGVCKSRLAIGATCQRDDECQAGAYCTADGQVCAGRRAAGQACASNAECESDNCTNTQCAPENNLALAFLCGSN
jgi:hypothetical protein